MLRTGDGVVQKGAVTPGGDLKPLPFQETIKDEKRRRKRRKSSVPKKVKAIVIVTTGKVVSASNGVIGVKNKNGRVIYNDFGVGYKKAVIVSTGQKTEVKGAVE